MARIPVFLVALLVLWGAQHTWGRLFQLSHLHIKPTNIVDLTFDEHEDGSPSAAAAHEVVRARKMKLYQAIGCIIVGRFGSDKLVSLSWTEFTSSTTDTTVPESITLEMAVK